MNCAADPPRTSTGPPWWDRSGEPEPVFGHAGLQILDPLGFHDVVDPPQNDVSEANGDAFTAVERDRFSLDAEGLTERRWRDHPALAHRAMLTPPSARRSPLLEDRPRRAQHLTVGPLGATHHPRHPAGIEPGATVLSPLTSGYATRLSADGLSTPPDRTTRQRQNNAPSRECAPSHNACEGAYVELVKAYSNHADHVERLRSLLDLPRAARLKTPERPPKQAQKRLDPEGIAGLVAAYTAGGRVKKLATEFGIHRDTVHNILTREGVLRPPGIQPQDLPEAIRLYHDGWSLARLAAEFDVSPSTVTNTLRRVGVAIRPPGPRPACP
jgi:lambda repressor-like predicted transcriptional regulator